MAAAGAPRAPRLVPRVPRGAARRRTSGTHTSHRLLALRTRLALMAAAWSFAFVFMASATEHLVPRFTRNDEANQAAALRAELAADGVRSRSLESPDTLVQWAKLSRSINKRKETLAQLEAAAQAKQASVARTLFALKVAVVLAMAFVFWNECLVTKHESAAWWPFGTMFAPWGLASDTTPCRIGIGSWLVACLAASRWLCAAALSFTTAAAGRAPDDRHRG